jgi:hypothetical protein
VADQLDMRASEGSFGLRSARRRHAIAAGLMAGLFATLLGVFILHSYGVRQLYWSLAALFSR